MSGLQQKLERQLWPFVHKPARYIGSEIGLVRKAPGSVRLRIALVYPDLYEVGMSNLGLKVLYQVANSLEYVAAERAFVPWPDMERLMREKQVPLYSLETFTPLGGFDLLGITLQSELTYTNVLTVLDLSGIPLRASDRKETDPLVCAGGPCAVNPEAMAPFFDFFVLGDGESVLAELCLELIGLKEEGISRAGRLDVLGRIRGVYVPEDQPGPEKKIVVTLREDRLDSLPAPDGLPVPLIEVAQDHLSVEIMRGCTCGCRFCQAGMSYRPVRLRSVEQITDLVRRGIRAGGWGSVTLLSLSSSDYPAIGELVDCLEPDIAQQGMKLAFPSMRVDSATLRLLGRIGGAKKGGLTFAVEAGSPRLRRVINKKVDEQDLLDLVASAFKQDWTLVKLYFMIGLPTETLDDVGRIARLIEKVASVGRAVPGRRNVNVTVSPFVPKPGTPFQWAAQDSPESSRQKIACIRKNVRSRSVRLKIQDPLSSVVEGVLARGDRRVAEAVHQAWSLGARLDGWSEHFDFAKWEQAFANCNLDWRSLLAERPLEEPLPWDFIRAPVDKDFLLDQQARALREDEDRDCRDGPCLRCGAETPERCGRLRSPGDPRTGQKTVSALPASAPTLAAPDKSGSQRCTWRVRHTKDGLLRFCGHLDMVRNIEFLLRRSGAPVLFSCGFSPRMLLHFGPPLPLGLASRAEYFDVETLPLTEKELRERLEKAAAAFHGFEILAVRLLPPGKRPHLSQDIVACRYRASFHPGLLNGPKTWSALVGAAVESRLAEGAVAGGVDRKGRAYAVNLSQALNSVAVDNEESTSLCFELEQQGGHAFRPDRFLGYLLGLDPGQTAAVLIEKLEACVRRGGVLASPMSC